MVIGILIDPRECSGVRRDFVAPGERTGKGREKGGGRERERPRDRGHGERGASRAAAETRRKINSMDHR